MLVSPCNTLLNKLYSLSAISTNIGKPRRSAIETQNSSLLMCVPSCGDGRAGNHAPG